MSRPTLSAAEMTEQRAFLRSIQETAGDDAPRLISADWLDVGERLRARGIEFTTFYHDG